MRWRTYSLVADADGMAGVGAALVAGDDVGLLGEHVDDLSLAFIAPLGADDHLNTAVVSSSGATKKISGVVAMSSRRRRAHGSYFLTAQRHASTEGRSEDGAVS